jgi:hypothetical protein
VLRNAAIEANGRVTDSMKQASTMMSDSTDEQARAVLLEDTFIFIKSPPVQIAIVGDASKPDQWAKLKALYGAMIAKVEACQPANSNAAN